MHRQLVVCTKPGGKDLAEALGLFATKRGQRRIQPTLKPLLLVPFRLAMPDEVDFRVDSQEAILARTIRNRNGGTIRPLGCCDHTNIVFCATRVQIPVAGQLSGLTLLT